MFSALRRTAKSAFSPKNGPVPNLAVNAYCLRDVPYAPHQHGTSFRCGSEPVGATWSASGIRAAHSCSACCRLVPACASSFGEYPEATQAVGGARLRKDEPTLRETFGSDNQIALQRINSAETGAAVEPPYTGSKPSLQIGQPSPSRAECDGSVAWPSTPSCEHLHAWWPSADASQDRHPPGNCTAWPQPGSRCKPSAAQTVAA